MGDEKEEERVEKVEGIEEEEKRRKTCTRRKEKRGTEALKK